MVQVPRIPQQPPNFMRLLVPKHALLHWAQDQGVICSEGCEESESAGLNALKVWSDPRLRRSPICINLYHPLKGAHRRTS